MKKGKVITEAELMDELRASMPKPPQPGEITVRHWAQHYNLSIDNYDISVEIIVKVSKRRKK